MFPSPNLWLFGFLCLETFFPHVARHFPTLTQVPLDHLFWKILFSPPSSPLQCWHLCPQLLRTLALRTYSCFLPWELFLATLLSKRAPLPKVMAPARASPWPTLAEEGVQRCNHIAGPLLAFVLYMGLSCQSIPLFLL